jgi:hypothetical protein
MRFDAMENDGLIDWTPVALRGGAVSICVPPDWHRLSRDDGGLAFQSPDASTVGPVDAMDLLLSLNTYANPFGVNANEAIQYLDRENVLPHGITPAGDEAADSRRWIAYTVTMNGEQLVYVWKVADFALPDLVRVLTIQLLVTEARADSDDDLEELVDRLGDESTRVSFSTLPFSGPVEPVTMRNVGHGDRVRFRLPWDWTCDQDGELALFLRSEPGTGSLRVAVHAFPHTQDESGDPEQAEAAARAVLQQTAEQFADGPDGRVGHGSVDQLPDGEVMARFCTSGEEAGEQFRFHLWLRGSSADGQTTLALFSCALQEPFDASDAGRQTVTMLEQEIRSAIITTGSSSETVDPEQGAGEWADDAEPTSLDG